MGQAARGGIHGPESRLIPITHWFGSGDGALRRFAITALAVLVVTACGGSASRRSPAKFVAAPSPVPVCSLLSAREVSGILKVRVRVHGSSFACTYAGTGSGGVYRSVVVTPQKLSAAPPITFDPSNGKIIEIQGSGYTGRAQNDPPSGAASGLAQAHAQVASGQVIVRVFVTYQDSGLRGVPQLREAATLAGLVGRRLARSKGRGATDAPAPQP